MMIEIESVINCSVEFGCIAWPAKRLYVFDGVHSSKSHWYNMVDSQLDLWFRLVTPEATTPTCYLQVCPLTTGKVLREAEFSDGYRLRRECCEFVRVFLSPLLGKTRVFI